MKDAGESAQQLRDVLEAIGGGDLEASGRERAFIAGALRAAELVNDEGAPAPVFGRTARSSSVVLSPGQQLNASSFPNH